MGFFFFTEFDLLCPVYVCVCACGVSLKVCRSKEAYMNTVLGLVVICSIHNNGWLCVLGGVQRALSVQ